MRNSIYIMQTQEMLTSHSLKFATATKSYKLTLFLECLRFTLSSIKKDLQ